jgi:Coenzyme PQQ synthesis protein D (PqqD)
MSEKRASTRKTGAKTKKSTAKASSLRFYGEEFIFDTVSGMFYRVNPTASFILRALQSGTEPERLADEVRSRYNIPRSDAMRDIELLRNDLTSLVPFGGVPA